MAPPPSMESEKRSPSLLGSLRTAVKKVRFLLSFSATRWILSSITGARPGAVAGATPRRVSFNSRPSLLDVEGSLALPARPTRPSRAASLGARSVSRTSSAAASELSRTSSGASSPPGDDDVDRRAELFIANFYKHIQMERQVSLQLRYCRGDSLERTPSR